MRTARIVLILAVAVLIASPLWAAPREKKAKKAPPCPADQRITRMLEGVTVTDDQKAKLDALKKEFGPKMVEARKKGDVLTPEQKKERAAAEKKAKEEGKKGKELYAAVAEAIKATDEQKAKMAEAAKEGYALGRELDKKVLEILTDEQAAAVKAKMKAAKKAK